MRVKPGSKRAAYAKHQKEEGERIRAMEMLLDAKWMNGYFTQRRTIARIACHCYFDRDGNVIPRPPERD